MLNVLNVVDFACQLPCAIAFIRESQNAEENVVTKKHASLMEVAEMQAHETGSALEYLHDLRC